MSDDLKLLREAAIEAGNLALEHRERGIKVWSKAGGSPVTSADLAVDKLLNDRLLGARPDYGWLSEETADDPERLAKSRLFVVDPIDGTVAFMKNKPWWTVALAVVENGVPVAAVVHAPTLNETYEASLGGGARLNGAPIQASDTDSLDDLAMLADAQLFEQGIWKDNPWPVMRVDRRNSIAYRMAAVASGAFDAALALSPKWDWDVVAGSLLVQEAGGRTTDHLGRDYLFNQPTPRQGSLVCAAPGVHPLLVARCAPIKLPI